MPNTKSANWESVKKNRLGFTTFKYIKNLLTTRAPNLAVRLVGAMVEGMKFTQHCSLPLEPKI